MAAPGSIIGQIGESFETIAKDVAEEVKQAPKDMVGSALESVGLSTGGKKNQKQATPTSSPGVEGVPQPPPQPGPSEEIKRAIARAALEELSGKKPTQKQESVWEKLQKEEEQKKEQKKQKAQAAKAQLPQASSKRKRGDLYGMKAKKTAAENRNVRQD